MAVIGVIVSLLGIRGIKAQDPSETVDIKGYVYKNPPQCTQGAVATIRVYDADGDFLGSTTSSATGYYQICDITLNNAPYDWRIVATIPNWGSQTKYVGQDDLIPGNVCGIQSDQHFEVDFCIPPRTPESRGGN